MTDPYDKIGEQYTAALCRSARDNLFTLRASVIKGWSIEEYRHFVQTGEQPAGKEFDKACECDRLSALDCKEGPDNLICPCACHPENDDR